MSKRTAEYWKKRFEALEAASNAYGQQTFRQIEPAFDQAQAKIQKEIDAWYGRFAKNNNITMQEARKLLNTKELKEFRWDVKEYIKYGQENELDQAWMKELENASARVHINRLEALKIRTQHAAEVAFGNELDCIDAMARKVFTEDYYHTIYEVQKGFGIGWEIGQIDSRKLDTLISKPWTTDNKTFKDRIWTSKNKMVSELHQQLTRTCVLGKAPDEAIKAMTKYVDKDFKNAKYAAGRLVMTEQAYFHSVAQKEAFNDLDVEEFEVVATLDSHTSEICQEMDGLHKPMSEYEVGVTAPPFHVFCRSVTVPWFEDNYTGERAARDEDGNTYYVPDSMKYQDWKKSMVDGNTEGLEVVGDTKNMLDLPQKPKRPKQRDFDNQDDYEIAKEKYRKERESYLERFDEIIQGKLNETPAFTTKKEVTEWADEIGIVVDDGVLESVDLRSFNEVKPTLEEMFKKYPNIRSYEIEDFDGSIHQTTFKIGLTDDGLLSANGGFNFNERMFADYEQGLRDGLEQIAEGWFVRGDGSFSGLVRHEYGHNVQNYIENAISQKYHQHVDDWRKHFNSLEDYKKARDAYQKERMQYETELLSLAKLEGTSEYSQTNMLELFAEGFAEYTSGGKSEFGKAFGEFLERWYK